MSKILETIAAKIGLDNTNIDIPHLQKYVEMVKKAQETLNLVSKQDIERFEEKHILDSLYFSLVDLEKYSISRDFSLIDLGSGGGCPGVPVACLYPEARITMLESISKKASFLNTVTDAFPAGRLSVINERIEIAAHQDSYRETFDIVTARALSNINTLLEYAIPFLRVGGIFVAYKTTKELQNIDELSPVTALLGAVTVETIPYKAENKEIERRLAIFKKIAETPKNYPRKVGKPLKHPLS